MTITRSFFSLAALCFLATPLHPSRLAPLTPSQKVAVSAGAVAAVPLLIMLAKKIAKKRLSKAEKAIYGTISGLGLALAAGALARERFQGQGDRGRPASDDVVQQAHRQQPVTRVVNQSADGNQTVPVYPRAEEEGTSSAFQASTTGADHGESTSATLQIPTAGAGAPMAIEGLTQRIGLKSKDFGRQILSISGDHLIVDPDDAPSCQKLKENLLQQYFPRIQFPANFTPTEALLCTSRGFIYLIIRSAEKTALFLQLTYSKNNEWKNNTAELSYFFKDETLRLLAYTQDAALIKSLASGVGEPIFAFDSAGPQPVPSSAMQGQVATPRPLTPDVESLMASTQRTDEVATAGSGADAAPGGAPVWIGAIKSGIWPFTRMVSIWHKAPSSSGQWEKNSNQKFTKTFFSKIRLTTKPKNFAPTHGICGYIVDEQREALLLHDKTTNKWALFERVRGNQGEWLPAERSPKEFWDKIISNDKYLVQSYSNDAETLKKLWPENPDRAPTPIV